MVEDWLYGTAEREEWNELGGYQIHVSLSSVLQRRKP